MSVIYNKVALIGLGLIASSMFWAMKRRGLAGTVSGYARSAATRDTARRIGLCDVVCDSMLDAVQDADLVVLAVPVGVMGEIAAEIGPHLKPGATVTDVGSVKREVIAAVGPHLPDAVHFVPGHPLAGTEHSGPESGFATLFDHRWCILVPAEGTDRGAVDRLRHLWEGLGSHVEEMEAEHHDLVLAVTSHAPHLIAYTMVGVADDLRRVTDTEVIKYCAAGFRDFTRIAASDPTMWRDVFLNNKEATLEILGRFTEELFALQRAIRTGDGDHLHDYFTRTRAIRRSIIEAGQDTDAPGFRTDESREIMRFILKVLVLVSLVSPALAKAPDISRRPVARGGAQAQPAQVVTINKRTSAHFRPSARPEVFEAALVARLVQRMSGLEPVARKEPLDFMQPLLAFATATPRAVARTLRPARRPPEVVQRAMSQRQKEIRGSVCGDPALQGETVGFVPGRISACGIKEGVRVRSVAGIGLTQSALIDCRTAKALKNWVNNAVKPAVGSRGGGLARLKVAAHYACRTRNNQPGAKVSEHGRGRAIDISGLILRDGSEITVLRGWRSDRSSALLRRIHSRACGIFGTVLGPNSDRFHQDHFHFDTARYRSGTYCR